jgi:hypothetical protein
MIPAVVGLRYRLLLSLTFLLILLLLPPTEGRRPTSLSLSGKPFPLVHLDTSRRLNNTRLDNLTDLVKTGYGSFVPQLSFGPMLLTVDGSNRATAVDALSFFTEPFPLTSPVHFGSDNRTRVMLFAVNVNLQPGEAVSALTVDLEDQTNISYDCLVEHAGQLTNVPALWAITIRLNDSLGDVGDVLVRIRLHGLESNRARMAIGHIGYTPVDNGPAVSMTAPANGQRFTAPSNITFSADARVNGSSIDRVEFYSETTLVGVDITSPYSISWNNVTAGNYSITAVATDAADVRTTSLPIAINVDAALPTPTPTLTPTPTPTPTATPTPTPTPTPGSGTSFYVSPSGSSTGTGAINQPWDLATALAQPAAVHPGDTIWLRGGTYGGTFTSRLTGTAGQPIIVRNYNNERAILDSQTRSAFVLTINGGYTWYWGLEVTCSDPNRTSLDDREGIANGIAVGIKLINCITHDNTGNGISAFSGWSDTEIYGNLAYYNGRTPNAGSSYAYGIYTQNQTGTKELTDNIVIHNYGNYPIHIYGSETAYLDNFRLTGNVAFNLRPGGGWVLIGGGRKAQNPVFDTNFFYGTDADSGLMDLGGFTYYSGTNNAVLRNNYIGLGKVAMDLDNTNTTMTGNKIYGRLINFTPSTYASNTYFVADWPNVPSRPSSNWVIVRPNKYEPGRANIVVYNWVNTPTVNVDVSGVLATGDHFEVRDAQNFYGPPVLAGSYTGGSLALPMTPNAMPVPISVPEGRSAPSHTSSEFGVFILLRR